MDKIKLIDVCDVIVPMRDKPKIFVNEDEWIPRCRIEDIDWKFLNTSKSNRFVSKKTIDEMHLRIFPKWTVICAVTWASIWTYAITTRPLITNQTFAWLVCKDGLYNEFLYYYIKLLTSAFINKSVWCAQAYITRETLENLEIPNISIDNQIKIAKILKDIDDKIELNNKINKELESMSRELYEYRFVQFDFPCSHNNNCAGYKSCWGKMVWNEELKREIPEWWEVKKIKNITKHINTWLNPRQNFRLNDGWNIKYITVKNLTKWWTIDFSWCDFITQDSKDMINARSKINIWDILFASIAPLWRCYLIYDEPKEREINESVFSIRVNKEVSSEYLYMYFMSKQFIKSAENSSTWSVFNWIRIWTLEDMNILVPNKWVLDLFSKKIKSIFMIKRNNEKQNNKLSELRDFLLPMLMNGQVTMK